MKIHWGVVKITQIWKILKMDFSVELVAFTPNLWFREWLTFVEIGVVSLH